MATSSIWAVWMAQVKLRGMRIELGEIETILASHEEIREAVVIVRWAKEGSRCLSVPGPT